MVIPTGAWAITVPITIINPSFEDVSPSPPLTYGQAITTVTGWTLTGSDGSGGGTWYPNAAYCPLGVPDGHNALFLGTGSASQLTQPTDTIQLGYQYNLGVYVDRASGQYAYSLMLEAEDSHGVDHPLATITDTASYRAFNYIQLDYTADSQYVGDRLKIVLSSQNWTNSFDQVTLSSSSPVPAPSTLLLLSSGLLGLTFLRSQRKNRP